MKWTTPLSFLTNQVEVHLIGCGGTGSFVMAELSMLHELLFRIGHPGLKVTAWDGSVVREANLGRQRFRVSDLGVSKAEALITAERLYNGFDWQASGDFVPETHHRYNDRDVPRIYITAVDKPSLRVAFGRMLAKRNVDNCVWIDAGNDHANGQVVFGAKDLPNAYDLFGAQYAVMPDDERKSCSSEEALARQDFGVNAMAARIVGQLMWNMLRHGGLDSHGGFFDVSRISVDPLPIDPNVWLTFGYSPPDLQVEK